MAILGSDDETKRRTSLIVESSIHEQPEGIILSMCITGTSSKDSLVSWINFLQVKIIGLTKFLIIIIVVIIILQTLIACTPNPQFEWVRISVLSAHFSKEFLVNCLRLHTPICRPIDWEVILTNLHLGHSLQN